MLLKKINKMNTILRQKGTEGIDFKQVLLDCNLLITQSDIKVIDPKTIDVEYEIMDITTDEIIKTRAIGKGQNIKLAQDKAYQYMQDMIFSYTKTNSNPKGSKEKTTLNDKNELAIAKDNNVVEIKDSVINRNQQKKLFAIASHEKIHELIEDMGYSSIKDIRVSDFKRIVDILEKDNINQNQDRLNQVPNIIIPFGKYKGKNLKDIIQDKQYIEYLYKNTKNQNIKEASAVALQIYKA